MKIFKPILTTSSLLISSILFLSCEDNMHENASKWEVNTEASAADESSTEYTEEKLSSGQEGYQISYVTDVASNSVSAGSVSASVSYSATAQKKEPEPQISKKIIKTANLRIQVEDLKSSADKITGLIDQHKAYASRLNETKHSYNKEVDMTIRVPIANFDSLVSQILQLAQYVHRKEIRANDVTEEFVDVMSRLKTKKEVEKRYLDILKQAKTIEEILQVEAQLASIREEIEAKEGRLKFLSDQVNFSTISLEVYQEVEYEAAPVLEAGFFDKTGKAIVSGWKGLLGFIIGIFYVWPLLVIGTGVFFIVRRYFKRRKLKDKAI